MSIQNTTYKIYQYINIYIYLYGQIIKYCFIAHFYRNIRKIIPNIVDGYTYIYLCIQIHKLYFNPVYLYYFYSYMYIISRYISMHINIILNNNVHFSYAYFHMSNDQDSKKKYKGVGIEQRKLRILIRYSTSLIY